MKSLIPFVVALALTGIAASNPPPLPPGVTIAPKVLLSPKAAQTQAAMGAPMKKAMVFVILPPQITNIVQSLEWDRSPTALGYTVYAGTNHGVYQWTTNISGPNATISFKTRDDYEFLYYAVKATNAFGASDYSIELRDPDWLANAEVISSIPAVPSLTLQTSTTVDFKSFTSEQVTLPRTNRMVYDRNRFYRALSPTMVTLKILEFRLLNTNTYPTHRGR